MTSAECLPLGLNAVKLICCEVPILLNNDLILISPAPIKVFALIVFSSHTSTRHLVVSTSLDETWHELFSWKFQKAEAPIFSFVSVLLEKCICQKLRDRFISYIYIAQLYTYLISISAQTSVQYRSFFESPSTADAFFTSMRWTAILVATNVYHNIRK